MLGLMQNHPLLISSLIDFAERHHGDAEIVSRRVEGDIHRYTYKALAARSRQVAHALDSLKLGFGDRVATLAWNGYRHPGAGQEQPDRHQHGQCHQHHEAAGSWKR